MRFITVLAMLVAAVAMTLLFYTIYWAFTYPVPGYMP